MIISKNVRFQEFRHSDARFQARFQGGFRRLGNRGDKVASWGECCHSCCPCSARSARRPTYSRLNADKDAQTRTAEGNKTPHWNYQSEGDSRSTIRFPDPRPSKRNMHPGRSKSHQRRGLTTYVAM